MIRKLVGAALLAALAAVAPAGAQIAPGQPGVAQACAASANQLLWVNSTGACAGLATGNSGVLVTSGGGVPSIATTLPSGLSIPSPSLTTPNLGTPSAATLTNATGLPIATGVSGLGTGVATGLGNAAVGTGGPVLETAAGQLLGTATNDQASAGNVGENVASVVAVGSAVSLSTGTAANLTSITLTAGDWDVSANCEFTGGGTTTVTSLGCSISTTSAVLDLTNGKIAMMTPGGATSFATVAVATASVQPVRQLLSTSTTIFAVAFAQFGTSTASVYGIIRARRVR